jgi:hypothetical protein
VAADPAFVDIDGRLLLRPLFLAEDQADLGVLKILEAQVLHGDRPEIEELLGRRVLSLGDATELRAGFPARGFRCENAVGADGVTLCPPLRPILDHIGEPTRRIDPQAEAGEFIVPEEVVGRSGLHPVDDALAELGHGGYLLPCVASIRVFPPEAHRKHQDGNSGLRPDTDFGVPMDGNQGVVGPWSSLSHRKK